MPDKVGFIGLGRMGLPMCHRLLKNGFELSVHNRSREKVVNILNLGAKDGASANQITKNNDIILTCLPDIATVEEIFLGSGGIIESCLPGQILVDHSTVRINTSKRCAEAAEAKGATFLDAPISGGTERAADGTLTIMVGGDTEAYEKAFPIFASMGTTVRHIGPTGTGTTVKLINQLLVGIHSVAAAEAMLLGAKSGADPALVYEVVSSGWGQSFMLDRNAPVMLDRDFEGIRTQISVFLKDLGLVEELAHTLNSPTPAGDVAFKILQEAENLGFGDKDGAAIVLPLENIAGFKINKIQDQN